MTTLGNARPATMRPPESDYLDTARYVRLMQLHTRERGAADAEVHAPAVQRLLNMEARLLDEQRFEEWLALFTPDCIYWVPANWPAVDPAGSVSITLDDRRRLEDRVARYRTGYAYSQLPLSRMTHTLGATECWQMDRREEVIARTAFHISELRLGEVNIYAGYYEHIIVDPAKHARIEEKRVHLLVADQPVKNISFLF